MGQPEYAPGFSVADGNGSTRICTRLLRGGRKTDQWKGCRFYHKWYW